MKVVISLGGSLINPGRLNLAFLKEFKNVISKFNKDKVIIVTGGGKIARDYIDGLSDKSEKIRSLIGIQATKLNAMLVSNFFDSCIVIPDSLSQIKLLLKKNKNAKFISRINFNDFLKIVMKIKYKPGQHFVLDQTAAEIITKYKIKTVILKGVNNLEGFLREKKFIGTVID